MRFLVDNQLPVALAHWLAATGSPADHVLDLGLQQASDTEIRALSIADGRIIVSKDDDFVILANRPGDQGKLLWVRIGNCRTPALLARFASVWSTVEPAFASGQRLVELR